MGGRQHPVGYHLAGRRVTVRIDGALLHLIDGHTLLRTLPNPLAPADLARIRDARPAGPEPHPATEPLRVQRKVSSRGQVVIAGQKIQVGIGHAGVTVTIQDTGSTFRISLADQVIAEVARTTTKPITRFKARKPEHRRTRRDNGKPTPPETTTAVLSTPAGQQII